MSLRSTNWLFVMRYPPQVIADLLISEEYSPRPTQLHQWVAPSSSPAIAPAFLWGLALVLLVSTTMVGATYLLYPRPSLGHGERANMEGQGQGDDRRLVGRRGYKSIQDPSDDTTFP